MIDTIYDILYIARTITEMLLYIVGMSALKVYITFKKRGH